MNLDLTYSGKIYDYIIYSLFDNKGNLLITDIINDFHNVNINEYYNFNMTPLYLVSYGHLINDSAVEPDTDEKHDLFQVVVLNFPINDNDFIVTFVDQTTNNKYINYENNNTLCRVYIKNINFGNYNFYESCDTLTLGSVPTHKAICINQNDINNMLPNFNKNLNLKENFNENLNQKKKENNEIYLCIFLLIIVIIIIILLTLFLIKKHKLHKFDNNQIYK